MVRFELQTRSADLDNYFTIPNGVWEMTVVHEKSGYFTSKQYKYTARNQSPIIPDKIIMFKEF